MAGRSLTRVQGGVTDTIHINTDKFAGVRTMSRTGRLKDSTTSIQVTVSGHSDLDGVYTGSGVDSTWTQQGGNGRIVTLGYNESEEFQLWYIFDNNDLDPNGESNHQYDWSGGIGETSPFPWTHISSSENVTITPAPETVTVNRTAPVIDSDRKGESRPLLSKLVGGAEAAYSLRDLNDKAGNNKVVRVRRASDNAERDFLAKEVSNGTLEAWVNSGNGVFQNTGYESFTNASATGFTASNTGGSGFAVTDIADGVSGDVIKVSFDIDITNGSPKFSLRGAMSGAGQESNVVTLTESGSYSITLTANDNYVGIGFPEGDSPSNFTVSNFKVLGNGFVETWYDQSGNGNDATQATATEQPKIVDEGSLLTAGVTFDGDDTLSVSDPVITASSSGVFSSFSVQTVATSEAGYLYGNASTSNGASFYAAVNKFTLSNKNSASLDNIPRSSGQNVLSAVYNNGDAGLLVNGAGTMTDAGTYGFASGTSDFVIGNRNGGTSAGTFLTGSINEIIIYNSDQSANRLAIEANINNQYDIY